MRTAKQIYSVADLQNWSEVARRIKPPIRLGVFGDPISHSLSPPIQNAALQECALKMQYVRILVSPAELSQAIGLCRPNGFVGLNLTAPHKRPVVALVDSIDESVNQLEAINTIAIRQGKLVGFNTDGVGFSRAVREVFSVDLRDLRVLVLGAGGAARAIAFECGRHSCERLVVASRTRSSAENLALEVQHFFTGPRVLGPFARLQAIGWTERELRLQLEHIDLVVNASPLGLNPSDPSPVAAQLLGPHLMVFDTTYGPSRSALIRAALDVGARWSTGLPMLLHQGAASFEIWFEREAPLGVMRAALEKAAGG